MGNSCLIDILNNLNFIKSKLFFLMCTIDTTNLIPERDARIGLLKILAEMEEELKDNISSLEVILKNENKIFVK